MDKDILHHTWYLMIQEMSGFNLDTLMSLKQIFDDVCGKYVYAYIFYVFPYIFYTYSCIYIYNTNIYL